MANNREISQFAGLVTVNDTTNNVTIGSTLSVSGDLDVNSGGVYYNSTNKKLGINTTSIPNNINLEIQDSSNTGINIRNTNDSANDTRRIAFSQGSGNLTSQNIVADIFGRTDGVSPLTGEMLFRTNRGNDVIEAMRIDSSGRILVGVSSASGNALLQVAGDSSSINESGSIFLHSNYAAASLGGGDGLGIISAGSNDGGVGASISFIADDTWGAGDYPSRIVFRTTADGASSPTERLRIDSTGNLQVGGTNGFLIAEYSDTIGNGENLVLSFAGASNNHRGQHVFQITYCNHTNNNSTLYAASFIVCITDSATTGYSLSMGNFQSIYNINSTVGSAGDLTFTDTGSGTATISFPNKVGAGGNPGNTIARVTVQRLVSGYGTAMYPTGAVAS